jgi:hypothetical protein
MLFSPLKFSSKRLLLAHSLHGVAANPYVSHSELLHQVQKWKRTFKEHPDGLTRQEFDALHDNGFVIKEVFDKDELSAARSKINELVDDLANALYAGGKITALYENEGFYTRLTKLESEFPDAGVLLHKRGILPRAFQDLWTHPKLMAVAEQNIGPEIAGHPVWNLRCKTPGSEHAVVPFHQDTAYLDPSSWSTFQLTAWLPMLDTNAKNGCMEVVRGGHRFSSLLSKHACR